MLLLVGSLKAGSAIGVLMIPGYGGYRATTTKPLFIIFRNTTLTFYTEVSDYYIVGPKYNFLPASDGGSSLLQHRSSEILFGPELTKAPEYYTEAPDYYSSKVSHY